MRDYSLSHLSDAVLLRDLTELVGQERFTIADVLAHIAEIDARKLYAPAGYSSMFVYCVRELRFSEDETSKRIQAARAARQYPILFTGLADGRLHLTAVCLLAPHLTPETVDELVEAAAHRRKTEIEDLLAARCVLPPPAPGMFSAQGELAPEGEAGLQEPGTRGEHAPEHVGGSISGMEHAPEHVAASRGLTSPAPHCQLTVRQSTREKLRYAQALLSHAIPTGDPSDVLDRALDLLISKTEKRRFGAGSRPVLRPSGDRARERRPRRDSTRYISAEVRHAVWERDRGRCTFVGTSGTRCNAQHFLELDHLDPRRKENTVEGLRLRCRTHNQLEAERVFGAEFMARKREAARLAAENARAAAEAARARAEAEAATKDQIRDVIAGLRSLGLRYSDARRAAESTLTMDRPSLEDRMRAALSTLTPRRQPMIRSIPPPAPLAPEAPVSCEHAPEHVRKPLVFSETAGRMR